MSIRHALALPSLLTLAACQAATSGQPPATSRPDPVDASGPRADGAAVNRDTSGGASDLPLSGSPPVGGNGGNGGGGSGGGPPPSADGGNAIADASPAGDSGAAPGAGPQVDRSMPALHSFSFRPSQADPEARDRDLNQTALLDTRAARVQGKLVVVLAGLGGAPGPAGVGRFAAAQGFHVFLVAYKNDFNPSDQSDPAFFGAARLEAFDGMDRTPRFVVSRADSIEARIAKAMTYLRDRHAGGDWGYYLDAQGQPRWPDIIFVGHSHGASSAAIFATVRPIHRAISLAGPRDVVPVTASWFTGPSVSPPEVFYGFTGTGDGQHQDHLKAFGLLKLPGEVIDVGSATPPYGGSHRLRYQGGHGGAADCDGYAAACRYMFGVQ